MSNVALDKKTLAIIMVASILLSSLISTSLVQFGVITPEQGEAMKSMIQQLMKDLHLTYKQVTSALEIEVGSKLYGLSGDYDYLLAHPLGDTSITAIKNGTTGTWDYWSANFSDVFMRANILMNKETYGGTWQPTQPKATS